MSAPASKLTEWVAARSRRSVEQKRAMAELGMADATDIMQLAAVVADLKREVAELRRPVRERVRAAARRALGGAT